MNVTTVTTARGNTARYQTRSDTNDGALVNGILGEDEYGLRSLPPLSGWAIDIGAHVGTVSIALALDNPYLRVLAVEAIPDNADLIRQTVRLNGLEERVAVLCAAASDSTEPVTVHYGWSQWKGQDPGYLHESRYIGGMLAPKAGSESVTVPGVTLAGLLSTYHIGRVALLKIDCEGCEWRFLRSPDLGRVDRILGEYHDKAGFAGIEALLAETHDLTLTKGGDIGMFAAVAR